jgi:cytochrome c5
MYSAILLTHRIVVSLFLLHYLVKTVLLLLDRKEQLAKYTAATRIVEMVVSVLFLVTGGWMLVQGAMVGKFMVIKLLCVFASIPLAVVGFKRGNKALALLSILLILGAYGLAEMNKKAKTGGKIDTSSTAADPVATGKAIYTVSCVNCHGADGKLGLSGAKDLSVTQLTMDEQKAAIRNGKNAMPGYKDLTDEQLEGLVAYIGTLRK